MKFDTIEQIITQIERMHPKAIKGWTGKYVYVLTPEIDTETHIQTTFQDLVDVGMDHFAWINPMESMENFSVHSVRKAVSGEFRGRLKGVLPGTFVYELLLPLVDADWSGEKWVSVTQKYPIVQKNDSITFLDCNRALSTLGHLPQYASKIPEISNEIIHGLNAAFDMKNMWGITYEYNGWCFVFSLEYEEIKQLLSKRDLDGLKRREVLPHIVKEHTRGKKRVPLHLRAADDGKPFKIHGREYGIMINPDIYESLTKYDGGIKRLKEWHERPVHYV